jgi:Ca-activated chloride channel homolog
MLEFEWPWAFVLVPLPILAWWLLPPYRDQQTSVHVPFFERLAEATGQTPQPGAVVLRRRVVQMIVAVVIWLLLIAALARPQRVGDAVTHDVSARDLILAVDISGSMDQVDFRTPDGNTIKRLDGVKHVLGDFISRRQGDRVALILFGSKAYIQVPFTQDLQIARTLLDQTEVGMAGQQTVIGDSIGLAIKTFETSKAQQKLVILLTDGNDTASRVPPEHPPISRGKTASSSTPLASVIRTRQAKTVSISGPCARSPVRRRDSFSERRTGPSCRRSMPILTGLLL